MPVGSVGQREARKGGCVEHENCYEQEENAPTHGDSTVCPRLEQPVAKEDESERNRYGAPNGYLTGTVVQLSQQWEIVGTEGSRDLRHRDGVDCAHKLQTEPCHRSQGREDRRGNGGDGDSGHENHALDVERVTERKRHEGYRWPDEPFGRRKPCVCMAKANSWILPSQDDPDANRSGDPANNERGNGIQGATPKKDCEDKQHVFKKADVGNEEVAEAVLARAVEARVQKTGLEANCHIDGEEKKDDRERISREA